MIIVIFISLYFFMFFFYKAWPDSAGHFLVGMSVNSKMILSLAGLLSKKCNKQLKLSFNFLLIRNETTKPG